MHGNNDSSIIVQGTEIQSQSDKAFITTTDLQRVQETAIQPLGD